MLVPSNVASTFFVLPPTTIYAFPTPFSPTPSTAHLVKDQIIRPASYSAIEEDDEETIFCSFVVDDHAP